MTIVIVCVYFTYYSHNVRGEGREREGGKGREEDERL